MAAALAPAGNRMVRLPGGTFRMGSDVETLEHQFPAASKGMKEMLSTETPAHEVRIPSFQLDRFAVTNAEFQQFTRARPEWRKDRIGGDYLRHWNGNDFPANYANLPVVFVSWPAAVAYAEHAGKRLPSEAGMGIRCARRVNCIPNTHGAMKNQRRRERILERPAFISQCRWEAIRRIRTACSISSAMSGSSAWTLGVHTRPNRCGSRKMSCAACARQWLSGVSFAVAASMPVRSIFA